jgi:ATP-dependent Lhr-like helicase
MALALQEGGIGRNEWLSWVEAVPAFRDLKPREVEAQVSWMLEKEILWDEAGVLWLGRRGQDTYGRKNFLELFSVFTSPPEFTVLYGRQELGSVHEVTFAALQDEGPLALLLAGRSWRVTHLDWKRRQAFVEPNDQGGRSRWWGHGQVLSHALCQAIRSVVAGNEEEPSWSRRTREHVAEIRLDYPWASTQHSSLVHPRQGEWHWWTFAGSRANASLASRLAQSLGCRMSWDNFAVRLRGPLEPEVLDSALESLRTTNPDEILPSVDDAALEGLKFADCLPPARAVSVLQARLSDPIAIRSLLSQPVHVVIEG